MMSYIPAWLIPVLLCLCFGGFLAAVVGGIFFFLNRGVQDVNRTWGDLGLATGLRLKPAAMFSQPELNGEFRQRPIRLYTYNAGTQGHRTTYTAVALTVANPTNSRLEITPSGTVGNFFGKMLNAQDVAIGNPAFDARFVIKSNPPDFAQKILAEPRVQMGIISIPDVFRIALEGSSLNYSKRDLEENSEFLTKLFNTLSDLADRLEGK
jgi:hypothetical protein